MIKKLSESDILDVCRLYQEDKLSSLEIGQMYNMCDSSIRKQLRKNKIPIRSVKESISLSKTHGKGRPKGHPDKGQRKPKSFIPKGAECHTWRGGITPINKAIRCLPKYKEWRKLAYERDNYTCQECEDRTKPGHQVHLHCDHIKPMCLIVQEYNIRTIDDANACEELWNLDNAKTLCITCHRETDTYGYKGRLLLGAQIVVPSP